MKFSLLLYFSLFFSFISAQSLQKYREIDSLIAKESMINAMTARRLLKEKLASDSTDAQFWLRCSKAAYVFYKYEEAKIAIDKAIRWSPADAELYFEKGLLYNRISELEPAVPALDAAIALKQEGKYYYWRGILNQQLEKRELAEQDYKNAISHKFESPEMYNNLAILLTENQKFPEALQTINKAIRPNINYPQAYSTRSKINICNFNLDAACEDAINAQNMGYRNVMPIPDSVCKGPLDYKLQFAADYLAVSKAYQQAIVAYSKLIEAKFFKSDYYLNRGYCYYQLKDYEHAEKDYLQALTLPKAAKDMIYDNLSLLYSDQDKFIQAIEYASKRIELNPKNHIPYLDRGYCFRKIKKYKEAEKDFNTCLALKPDYFRAFGYRSFLFYELGKINESYDDALKAVTLNSKYGYGYIVLAQAKQQLGIPDFCADLYKAQQYGEPAMAEAPIQQYCK